MLNETFYVTFKHRADAAVINSNFSDSLIATWKEYNFLKAAAASSRPRRNVMIYEHKKVNWKFKRMIDEDNLQSHHMSAVVVATSKRKPLLFDFMGLADKLSFINDLWCLNVNGFV